MDAVDAPVIRMLHTIAARVEQNTADQAKVAQLEIRIKELEKENERLKSDAKQAELYKIPLARNIIYQNEQVLSHGYSREQIIKLEQERFHWKGKYIELTFKAFIDKTRVEEKYSRLVKYIYEAELACDTFQILPRTALSRLRGLTTGHIPLQKFSRTKPWTPEERKIISGRVLQVTDTMTEYMISSVYEKQALLVEFLTTTRVDDLFFYD
jgi:hypothetical protein